MNLELTGILQEFIQQLFKKEILKTVKQFSVGLQWVQVQLMQKQHKQNTNKEKEFYLLGSLQIQIHY